MMNMEKAQQRHTLIHIKRFISIYGKGNVSESSEQKGNGP